MWNWSMSRKSIWRTMGRSAKTWGAKSGASKQTQKNGHGQAFKRKMKRYWEKSGKPSMLRGEYCWRTTSAPKVRIAGLIVTPLDASKSATSAPAVARTSSMTSSAVSSVAAAVCSVATTSAAARDIGPWTMDDGPVMDPGRWTMDLWFWATNDATTPRCVQIPPKKKGQQKIHTWTFFLYGPKLWITFVLMSCLHMIADSVSSPPTRIR